MPARSQREAPAIAEEVAGSAFELSGAGLGLVLGALGLVGVARLHMAAFGMIAVGFALLAHGSTLALRWSGGNGNGNGRGLGMADRRGVAALAIEVGGGFSAIVLGVVAASDVHPRALLPAAAIVLGLALVLAGALRPPVVRDRAAPRASTATMIGAGALAIALGVFAVAGGPIVPSALVVVVCTAGALLVAGHALAGPLVRRFA